MADLTTSVQFIKGIGPQKAKALEKLGILTLRDLIGYFPRRYEDRRETRRIAQLPDGASAFVAALIASPPTPAPLPQGGGPVKGRAGDETRVPGVTLFNPTRP